MSSEVTFFGDKVHVRLPDGAVQSYPRNITPIMVATEISGKLARDVVAAEFGGKIIDVNRPLGDLLVGVVQQSSEQAIPMVLLTSKDAKSLNVLRHSAAHIMARAVMRLYPGVSLAFGPTTPNGFYYDFELKDKIVEADFARIEAEMQEIINAKEPFERIVLSRVHARELCQDLSQFLKVEHIDSGLAGEDTLSFYKQGEFIDLCRGPHLPDVGRVKGIKILSVAGAYWKGNASGKQLQRLYGTAFFEKKDLDNYLEQVEEAKRRDHRVLGKKHGLFSISSDVGSGLVLWQPKGARVRLTLENFLRGELLSRGYEPVYSPHLARVQLYETSGHFPFYRESQFPPLFGNCMGGLVDSWIHRLDSDLLSRDDEEKLLAAAKVLGVALPTYEVKASTESRRKALMDWQIEQERYLIKPMNCPHHCQIFKAQARSYRQLPLRLFEFGTVYRHEQTGELNGMLRVRGFTQDDAHIFCTPQQVEDEFKATIELTKFVLNSVGLNDYQVQLSLRDPASDKYVGSRENWDRAETALRGVLVESGFSFEEQKGEAAFYGPKADFMVRDCIGRSWQLGTVQLDYNLPERFRLEYKGVDNEDHRPVMIHRAPFGSLERFTGMLIEHFAGAFPLWLSPEQIRVLPLSDKSVGYALSVAKELGQAGLSVTVDTRDGKIQGKIRDAQLDLVNYMAIVGPKESDSGTISLRDRIDGDLGVMPVQQVTDRLTKEIHDRTVRQAVATKFCVNEVIGSNVEDY
jgi:threonyl-tRNA synthetase